MQKYWIYFIFLTILIIDFPTKIYPAHHHRTTKIEVKLMNQIIKNHPKISKRYALQLSTLINKISQKYKISSKLYTAILMQESIYQIYPINCRKQKCKDFGIAQINICTIKHFNFNIKQLNTNLKYSLDAGAKVLADFHRMYGQKEKKWWTRYNTSNPVKRRIYERKVKRFLD